MTSKNVLLAMTLLALVALLVVALRQEPSEASVWDISRAWAGSGHADAQSASFTNWDEADPPLLPATCALCHSAYGFTDFLGADGSPAGQVDADARVGSVLFCTTCHNDAALQYTAVTYPSGATLSGLGREALCMTCHHGRQSTAGVNRVTAGKPEDTVIEGQGFVNPHYYVASATQAGGEAHGAYEYDGQAYVGRFEHTATMRTCIACHDPHSLGVDPRSCSPCHSNVVEAADLVDVRQSTLDHDGDGDVQEGIASELEALHARLYEAIREYARSIVGLPIAHHPDSFPYFFADQNDDGRVRGDEASPANRYANWTPRLLRAAYNYQFVDKDPGGFVHNPKYLLQVTYDSLADLGQKVRVDMADLTRP